MADKNNPIATETQASMVPPAPRPHITRRLTKAPEQNEASSTSKSTLDGVSGWKLPAGIENHIEEGMQQYDSIGTVDTVISSFKAKRFPNKYVTHSFLFITITNLFDSFFKRYDQTCSRRGSRWLARIRNISLTR